MAKRPSRAIVVGGGVGGLTAAVALRQAGIETLVFERQSGPVVGTGLHLASNAMRALQHLGLASEVTDAGTVVERSEFLNSRGEPLAEWPMGEIGRKLGAPAVGITRPDLVEVLREALGPEAFRSPAECTGFAQDEAGVTARFADGSEERADVLIGADGLRSAIRAQLLGNTEPRYRGYQNARAVIAFDEKLAPSGVFRQYWGKGSLFLFYRVGGGRLYWVAPAKAPLHGSASSGQRKEALLARYRDYADPVPEVIRATPEDEIVESPSVDRDPVTTWGTGRVTLLGDAAHPMIPTQAQGACQAIEDGVVLGKCLGGGDDAVAALRAYEARRMERTASVVKQSQVVGKIGLWESPFACALRDSMLRVALGPRALPRVEKRLAFEP